VLQLSGLVNIQFRGAGHGGLAVIFESASGESQTRGALFAPSMLNL
jgi:hypothetical protein